MVRRDHSCRLLD